MSEIINPFAGETPSAFYLHVPFCHQKCRYCDFYSFVPGYDALQLYVSNLVKEIELTRKNYGGADPLLHSIYLGGGTPSLLAAEGLAQILETLRANFTLAADCEITLEANPESVSLAKLQAYRQLGINRLSLGLQSTDNQVLKLLGRLHSYEDFLAALAAARQAGFSNISADLMFGLPGQSLADFKRSVNQVLALPLQHLSYYSLQLEEGTPLGDYFLQAADPSSKLASEARYLSHPSFPPLPSEEDERAMYHYLLDTLLQHGFQPYEISNAAKPGYESRHNSLYWQARPYFACGPAAASYVGGLRHTRAADFNQWAAAVTAWEQSGTRPSQLFADQEPIDGPGALAEFFMLGFRMLRGVSLSQCEALFGPGAWKKYQAEFSKLRAEGLICPTSQGYKLTQLGLDLANQVFMAFI